MPRAPHNSLTKAEFKPSPGAPPSRSLAFLLVERFGLTSTAAAIDVLRSANRLSASQYYSWSTISIDGEPATASNGLQIKVDHGLANFPAADMLFVSAGMSTEFAGKSKVLTTLRNWGRRGGVLGALSVGSQLLAEAGQLDGYRCTIHWENRAGFMERFPEIECTGNVYEIDRKRYTSAGGTTCIDLMLEIIRVDFGAGLANAVANQFHHERIRSAVDRQRVGPERDLSGKSDKLRKTVELMADSLDEPLSAVQLAKAVGLSVRQVERLFLRHMNMTPGRYYMRLRLERARELLRQTNMPILDIAVATGFTSHSYFAQSYRQQFGRPPSEERRTTY